MTRDRHLVGDRAPQPVERQADGPAQRVPDRGVQRGDRLERQAPVTEDVVGRGLHVAPAALGITRAPAQDRRRQLVVDDPDDQRLLVVGVAAVGLGGDAVRGGQPDHDRAAVVHRVGGPGEPAPERGAQGDGLDAVDDERAGVQAGSVGAVDGCGPRIVHGRCTCVWLAGGRLRPRAGESVYHSHSIRPRAIGRGPAAPSSRGAPRTGATRPCQRGAGRGDHVNARPALAPRCEARQRTKGGVGRLACSKSGP